MFSGQSDREIYMRLHSLSVILDLRLAIQELDETVGLVKFGEKAADIL